MFSDTCVHCCSLQDTWAFFLRQLCVGRSCPRQAIHQTRSVTSHCRPCGSATSRRHKLRWVLDLPSLPTIDYNRNVSARGCTGRVIRRLRSLRCQLMAASCWLTCRGRARWCGLWHVSRFWRTSGYTALSSYDLLQSSGLVKVHGVFQKFFRFLCDHALQLVCLLFIPKFQQALHFRVRNVCDELTNQESQDLKFQSRLPPDPGVTFRNHDSRHARFRKPTESSSGAELQDGISRVRVALQGNASITCVGTHCLKAISWRSSLSKQAEPIPNSCDMNDAQILIAYHKPMHKALAANGYDLHIYNQCARC